MGGSKGQKTHTPGKQAGQMSAFFQPSTPTASQTMADKLQPNMADELGTVRSVGAQLSKANLEDLGTDLKEHFSALDQKLVLKLNPISKELKAFKSTLSEIAMTANMAFEMASAMEKQVSGSAASEKHLKEKNA